MLENRDHANWTAEMTPEKEGFAPKPVTRLRPGHADLAGALKYGHADVRNQARAEEAASALVLGEVENLIGNDDVTRRKFLLQRSARADADNALRAQ